MRQFITLPRSINAAIAVLIIGLLWIGDPKVFFTDLSPPRITDFATLQLIDELPLSDATLAQVLSGGMTATAPLKAANTWRDGIDPRFVDQAAKAFAPAIKAINEANRTLDGVRYAFFIDLDAEVIRKYEDASLFYAAVSSPFEFFLNGNPIFAGDRYVFPSIVRLPSRLIQDGKNRLTWVVKNRDKTRLFGLNNRHGLSLRSGLDAETSRIVLLFQQIYPNLIAMVVMTLFALHAFQAGHGKSYADIKAYISFCVSLVAVVLSLLPIVYLPIAAVDPKNIIMLAYKTLTTGFLIAASNHFAVTFYRIRRPRLKRVILALTTGGILCVFAEAILRRSPSDTVDIVMGNFNAKIFWVLVAAQILSFVVGYWVFHDEAKAILIKRPHEKSRLKARGYDIMLFAIAMFAMIGLFLQKIPLMWVTQGFDFAFLAGLIPAYFMHRLFIRNIHRAEEFEERIKIRLTEADEIVYYEAAEAMTKIYVAAFLGADLAGFKKIALMRVLENQQIDRIRLADDLIRFVNQVKVDIRGLVETADQKTFIKKRMGDYWLWLKRYPTQSEANEEMVRIFQKYRDKHEQLLRSWRATLSAIIEKHIPVGFSAKDPKTGVMHSREGLLAFARRITIHPQLGVLEDVMLDVEGDDPRFPESPVDFISDEFSAVSQPTKDSDYWKIAVPASCAPILISRCCPEAKFVAHPENASVGYLVVPSFEGLTWEEPHGAARLVALPLEAKEKVSVESSADSESKEFPSAS